MSNVNVTVGSTDFEVTLPSYTISVTLISGAVTAGSGDNNLKQKEVSGTINGSNTAFTVNSSFDGKSFIIIGQTFLIEDVHYTVSGTDITMTDAIPAGLSGNTPYLYHG